LQIHNLCRYSEAPPLKLKQEGWRGNYALGASYIALPWWAGQAVFGELSLDVMVGRGATHAPARSFSFLVLFCGHLFDV
jgi:4-hydroxybenzoate polyprenyltransferase